MQFSNPICHFRAAANELSQDFFFFFFDLMWNLESNMKIWMQVQKKCQPNVAVHSSLIGSSCPRIPSPNRPTYLLVQSLFLISSVHANVCESNNLQWTHCAEEFLQFISVLCCSLQVQSTFAYVMWKKRLMVFKKWAFNTVD